MIRNIDGNGWKALLTTNEVLSSYGNNAIGLLALSLRFDIDDIALTGSDAFVDGRDDKKNDFVYIDQEKGVAVVIQAYYTRASKQIAPSNKASDLNTALLWLLSAKEKDLPEGIKEHALRLRAGINSNCITKLHVWYVHNCTESKNVEDELKIVNEALNSIIKDKFKKNNLSYSVLEVGSSTLSEWYLQSFSPIYVNDSIKINCDDGFEIQSEKWTSFVTSIPARELHHIYKKHKSDLFSANIRDYLGDRESDTNINFGIKDSIRRSPADFWVFNNGLTVLTNDFSYNKEQKSLDINGISIVNGAQTTGAIGTIPNPPKHEAMILARFIKVKNQSKTLIGNIVKYNNSQNKVTAADFRSNDATQKRLTQEVKSIDSSIFYQGGRRGGEDSAIKRNKNTIPSFTVAQALAAFHGDPINAYNKKSFLWIDDSAYSKIFNEKTTGAHIIFVYSLFKKIETIKFNLLNQTLDSTTKDSDKKKIDFFRKSGSVFVFIYAISKCIEIFLEKSVTDKFTLNFGNKSLDVALKNWDPIINQTISFISTLEKGMKKGLNEREIDNSVDNFRQLIESYFENVANTENRFKRDVRFK